MRVEIQIRKPIGWHVLFPLVVLDDGFGSFSPLPIFVSITMF
jgi:hypothetical protein